MGKKLTLNEFIEKANIIHDYKYDYSKVNYINIHTKVCIICPEHGEFLQTPSNHLSGRKCQKCATVEVHKKQRKSYEEFIKTSNIIHNNTYDYSKVNYINNHTKICIICPEHGEFWQTPLNHTQGKGCPFCSGTKKLTTDVFIQKANNIHSGKYDYSKVEYIKSNRKVCIICPIHGEFWQTPNSHLGGNGCSKCSKKKKYTTEEFIKNAKKIHGEKYDYSKVNYINNETPVCIMCPEHGEFFKRPSEHLLKASGCPYCKGFYKSLNEVIDNFKKVHGDRYNYSKVEYKGTEIPVCIICPEHGEFWQTPYVHSKGSNCPKCVGVAKMDTNEFIKKAKNIHGDRYDYSKVNYINSHTKVEIICPEHGCFWQMATTHLRGCGCQECNTNKNSKIVQIIESKLNELNILFEKEKTFDWLKNKSNMYIDFYLPEYNVGIECHGIQHFESIAFFGGDDSYNETIYRDLLKYKLCSENNIKIYYFTKIDTEYFDKIYCDENILMEDICKVKRN